LNIKTLFVIDSPPPPLNRSDFDIINLKDVSNIYFNPEYILTNSAINSRIAVKNFPTSKVISIDRGGTEHIYRTFMEHLPELQEVYESLIDEESKKTFAVIGSAALQIKSVILSARTRRIISAQVLSPKAARL